MVCLKYQNIIFSDTLIYSLSDINFLWLNSHCLRFYFGCKVEGHLVLQKYLLATYLTDLV